LSHCDAPGKPTAEAQSERSKVELKGEMLTITEANNFPILGNVIYAQKTIDLNDSTTVDMLSELASGFHEPKFFSATGTVLVYRERGNWPEC
jgi:hypothetical protein